MAIRAAIARGDGVAATMTTMFCWLIERYNGPELVYWTGRKGEGFSSDVQWAVRFARFEDAEQVRVHVAIDGHACRSVQHGFADGEHPMSAITPNPE